MGRENFSKGSRISESTINKYFQSVKNWDLLTNTGACSTSSKEREEKCIEMHNMNCTSVRYEPVGRKVKNKSSGFSSSSKDCAHEENSGSSQAEGINLPDGLTKND